MRIKITITAACDICLHEWLVDGFEVNGTPKVPKSSDCPNCGHACNLDGIDWHNDTDDTGDPFCGVE